MPKARVHIFAYYPRPPPPLYLGVVELGNGAVVESLVADTIFKYEATQEKYKDIAIQQTL